MTQEIDDFFDEDGNIIETSWGIEEKKRKQAQQQRIEEEEHNRKIREANRRISIDEENARIAEKRLAAKKKRLTHDEWMSMPVWVKSMPRTPLNAPPTEGRKEKLVYSMTGKVTLTESERKRRKVQANRLLTAMDDHRKLSQDINTNDIIPVSIVSLSQGAGGTMLTSMLSKVMHMSRPMGEIQFSVDFGPRGNKFSDYFGSEQLRAVFMNNIINFINDDTVGGYTVSELIPSVNSSEYYLPNHPSVSRYVAPEITHAAGIYRWARHTNGFMFFDCDSDNTDATAACLMLSLSVVIVVPPSNDALSLLDDFYNSVSLLLGDDAMRKIMSRAIIVVSGDRPALGVKSGVEQMRKLVYSVAQKIGSKSTRGFVIPFDRGLQSTPLDESGLLFHTMHITRLIGGTIVDDAVNAYR